MSSHISRSETFISLQLPAVDATGELLRQRVTELLAARPDLSRTDLGNRIKRGHSWISEFLAGRRTTNDIRLVIKIARVFGVSVGYLLGENDRQLNAGAASLLSTWATAQPRERKILLDVAASLRQPGPANSPGGGPEGGAAPESSGNKRAKGGAPRRLKR